MSKEAVGLYRDNGEHLRAELTWLDVLIHREVLAWRRTLPENQSSQFPGLFISDGEINALLDSAPKAKPGLNRADEETLADTSETLRAQITERKQAALQKGIFLALPRLARCFGLSPFEEHVVLLCLAPELDRKYEKLYAYLQDDIARKRPSLDLAIRLFCRRWEDELEAHRSFSPHGPLFRAHLIYRSEKDESLLTRILKPDDAVIGFLLGIGQTDRDLAAWTRLVTQHADFRELRWPESLKIQLLCSVQSHLTETSRADRKLIYHFHGASGTGKKSLASAVCREISAPLLVADLRLIIEGSPAIEDALRKVYREGILLPAAIYLDHFDVLLGEDSKTWTFRQTISRYIDEFSWLTFLATESPWEPGGLFGTHRFLSIELPAPDLVQRAQLWENLSRGVVFEDTVDWGEVAAKFRLTPGKIQDALVSAGNYVFLRSGGTTPLTAEDVHRGCRAQSNQKLSRLSRKLSPRNYSWSDITLPAKALAQLREIRAQVKHRRTVYGAWGFDDKFGHGRGLCALFHGPSGTGKTMAAEIMARELDLEAYKIDLSTVVSKYIGETEKNLAAIFQEAETSNAILFFDEADALFGKRSEVKDAHDRYANIEINYLLQRIEEFEGLVILATNFRKNIDDAFFRRMQFAVEFPFPNEVHRYRIWHQHFPSSAPVADDVDFNFLAKRFNITGGNIKNIVVNAAFLAAANSGVIHMEDLIRATKREYEKIGRMCTETEFAPYQHYLREA